MKQRKLTGEEQQHVLGAIQYLRRVTNLCGHFQRTGKVLDQLTAMERHGTTDGERWNETPPEFSKGCRAATVQDALRRDREIWNGECWQLARIGLVMDGEVYQVPVDRIPTDEDARQSPRPTVMVRDSESHPWTEATLYGVRRDGGGYWYIAVMSHGLLGCWKYARHVYPGE